jgi:hypothetical protein
VLSLLGRFRPLNTSDSKYKIYAPLNLAIGGPPSQIDVSQGSGVGALIRIHKMIAVEISIPTLCLLAGWPSSYSYRATLVTMLTIGNLVRTYILMLVDIVLTSLMLVLIFYIIASIMILQNFYYMFQICSIFYYDFPSGKRQQFQRRSPLMILLSVQQHLKELLPNASEPKTTSFIYKEYSLMVWASYRSL